MNTSTTQSIEGTVRQKTAVRSDGFWGFFVLTYGLTFLTWGLLVIFQLSVASATNTQGQTWVIAMLAYLFGGFSPTIAGFIMAYRVEGRAGVSRLWKRFTQIKLGGKWYLVIFAIPLANFAIFSLVHMAMGGKFVSPDLQELPGLMISLVITVFLFGPVSEEFGWRGFALDRVQARWGEIKGSVVLGLIWAFWHLPLFFIPGSGQQVTGDPGIIFPLYALTVMGYTFLITWVYNNTGRSVWGATFFHFTLNFGTVMLLTFTDASDAFGYQAGAGVYTVFALLIAFFTKLQKGKRIANDA